VVVPAPPATTRPPVDSPPTTVGDSLAPVVSGLSVSGRRAGRRPTVRLTVSEPSVVDVRLQRLRKGVRRGGRCRTSRSARRRGGRACRRYVTLVRLRVETPGGAVKRRLGGRRLAPGRHRVLVRAEDAAGNVSSASSLVFTSRRVR
ncbi:MAG TPA: hypothetical protein VF533_05435, partial [Solirubrobacteraceae bacterium]